MHAVYSTSLATWMPNAH